MKKIRLAAALCASLTVGSCGKFGVPETLGERDAGYAYIPLDPLPVQVGSLAGCRSRSEIKPADTMDALPDNAVRIAVRDVTGSADASAVSVVIGTSGRQYKVVLDYISVDTANLTFAVPKNAGADDAAGAGEASGEAAKTPAADPDVKLLRNTSERLAPGSEKVVIPVYVGVGLRLTAQVEVIKGKVNLGSLGAIAASTEAQRAAGSLVVQTLGINGPQVAASLPVPSELNATTIQNAILSLGSIKAILYDHDTQIVPRVTGIYYPFPKADPKLINAIVSELAKNPVLWNPCKSSASTAAIAADPRAAPAKG